MKTRIAVITMGVKLAGETRGYTRYWSLATMLAQAGFAVDLITTRFQHWDKAHRDLEALDCADWPFNLVLLDEPGYTKNLSLKRVFSHAHVARELSRYLEQAEPYQLIYAQIPPNDIALAAARFAERHNVPFIVDVNDLWPEAMHMVFDVPVYTKNLSLKRVFSHAHVARELSRYLEQAEPYQLIYVQIPPNDIALAAARFAERHNVPFIVDVNDLWPEAMHMVFDVPVLSTLLFSPFAHDAREVYRRVNGVVGTSDEYAARPFTDCPPNTERLTVYVGNELNEFDAGAKASAPLITSSKAPDAFWVTYAGTLGASYDIATMVRAAALMKEQGLHNIETLILGDGPDRASLEELARSLNAPVRFVGYTPYDEMAAYLKTSDILVNSLVKKAPQSILNKIADYLAAGKPLLDTGSSPELRTKIAAQDFGVSIEAEDPTLFVSAVEALYRDPTGRARMGANARKVAEAEFDRKSSYPHLIDFIARKAARE